MTVHYSVQAGDTFRSIAADHGVTAGALALANPWVNMALTELPGEEWDIAVNVGWLLHIPEPVVDPPPPPPPPAFTVGKFVNTGPTGGGFPNVATWDPNVPGRVYVGADIGGISRSDDWGKTFTPDRYGVGWGPSQHKIACLNAVNLAGNTLVVAGTGFKGTGGEVYSRVDGWDNQWAVDSTALAFSAQNSNAPLPTKRPRSTDPGLILRLPDGRWVAGTYKDGVYISGDRRKTWKRLDVFTGQQIYVRTMCLDPYDPNAILVGLWGDDPSIPNKGLWRISRLNGSPVAARLAGVPDVVESLAVSGQTMYAACGRFGVRRIVDNTVTDIAGPIYETCSAAIDAHGDLVVVGTAGSAGKLYRSYNRGDSWKHITMPSDVDPRVWGSNEIPLALEDHPSWRLGGTGCDISCVAISPHDPNRWVITATSAVWATDDAGATFRPSAGYQISSYRVSAINDKGHIATGSTDHDVICSTDRGATWRSIGVSGATVTHAIAFSPDGTELAYSISERDDNQSTAKLWVTDDLEGGSPGVDTGWSATVPGKAGKRVIGLTWITMEGLSDRLVCAVDGGGIWTYSPNGDWTQRSAEFMGPQQNRNLHCDVVSNGMNLIYVADRETGVWRSDDYGVTWTKYSTTKNARLAMNRQKFELWVDVGPCAYGAGRWWRWTPPQNAQNPDGRLSYTDGDPEGWWTVVDDDMIRATAPEVTSIAVNAGLIVLTTGGQGLLIGTYS